VNKAGTMAAMSSCLRQYMWIIFEGAHIIMIYGKKLLKFVKAMEECSVPEVDCFRICYI